MPRKTYNVLFLCTGNSARSILAEAILGTKAKGRFTAFSAGSHPGGKVQPIAAELAREIGYDADRIRSKSWDEFSGEGAPRMDIVITVCDNAADECCPVWIGHPLTAHWGVPDPVATAGDDGDRRRAYLLAFDTLSRRIDLLIALPLDEMDRIQTQVELGKIGKVDAR